MEVDSMDYVDQETYAEIQEIKFILDSYAAKEMHDSGTTGSWLSKRAPLDFETELTDEEFWELVHLTKKTCTYLKQRLEKKLDAIEPER